MAKPIIFCDFDGTVTQSDNIIAIMKKFAPPEWLELKDQILSRKISINEGVGKLFSLLSSDLKDDITKFAIENAKIRPGFKEFVDFARVKSIPLYIVSGGIDFFVQPILAEYAPFDGIYCNESDFSGETIEILWPHKCDSLCDNDCGCCKPSIIRQLNCGEDSFKIVIGDSVTDLEAAKHADFVLARDLLQEKCEEWGINHQGFQTFFDCIDEINKRIEVGELSC
ncbi:2-hydroxy-3-keto-5-methylthiopentenyl-1-phosphate phosphatase [Neobacillus bataviensis LMG 21833]|uniref:2-hydroxy-3-keto-5-methylthiopentenyl-1-phosphate phosphatase n=1 Tax=Neobacillus bataviensis LMG 21833 TaxID=1117379 RepID=K6DEC5_9BACI|nr:2-hydroxy-3-keto-5-methylthiopentenyl-1-phosphate phosphatase [Neobacillus bataviensis]EKN66418.1 2-hydroxy-3-keto-5-methylthiopentenyl-1-phosphate phosphatase [Neobacillus bataviensis LMG 21833]